MQTRRLGSDGPEITTLGLGAWTAGGVWQYGVGPQDDAESIAAIQAALDAGITWIETAPAYGLGHSEEIVGRALAGRRTGEDVLVFTKVGLVWDDAGVMRKDLSSEAIRRGCDESLRRLGVDRIDLYQCHWPDTDTCAPIEESWATLDELVREGKVRWLGVSNFDVDLLERCEAIRHVDSLQPPLALVDRAALDDVIPWCREHGTGVIVYSPMGSGLLTGSFTRERLESLTAGDYRRDLPTFQEPGFSRALELVERLRPIADRLETNVATIAVGWTIAQPGVTAAIVGARRPEQLRNWIRAREIELDDATLAEIDFALAETGL